MKISESTQIIELPENPKQLATPESSLQIVYSQDKTIENKKYDNVSYDDTMEEMNNGEYPDFSKKENGPNKIDSFALTRSVTPLQSLIILNDTVRKGNPKNTNENISIPKDIAILNDIFDIKKKPSLQRHLNSFNHIKDLKKGNRSFEKVEKIITVSTPTKITDGMKLSAKMDISDDTNRKNILVPSKIKKEQPNLSNNTIVKKTSYKNKSKRQTSSKPAAKKMRQEKLNVRTRNMNKINQEQGYSLEDFGETNEHSRFDVSTAVFGKQDRKKVVSMENKDPDSRLKEISREELPQTVKNVKQEQQLLMLDDTTTIEHQLIKFPYDKTRFTYNLQQQIHDTVMEHQIQLNDKLDQINNNIGETIIKINNAYQMKLISLQNELKNDLDELKSNIKTSLEDF